MAKKIEKFIIDPEKWDKRHTILMLKPVWPSITIKLSGSDAAKGIHHHKGKQTGITRDEFDTNRQTPAVLGLCLYNAEKNTLLKSVIKHEIDVFMAKTKICILQKLSYIENEPIKSSRLDCC